MFSQDVVFRRHDLSHLACHCRPLHSPSAPPLASPLSCIRVIVIYSCLVCFFCICSSYLRFLQPSLLCVGCSSFLCYVERFLFPSTDQTPTPICKSILAIFSGFPFFSPPWTRSFLSAPVHQVFCVPLVVLLTNPTSKVSLSSFLLKFHSLPRTSIGKRRSSRFLFL